MFVGPSMKFEIVFYVFEMIKLYVASQWPETFTFLVLQVYLKLVWVCLFYCRGLSLDTGLVHTSLPKLLKGSTLAKRTETSASGVVECYKYGSWKETTKQICGVWLRWYEYIEYDIYIYTLYSWVHPCRKNNPKLRGRATHIPAHMVTAHIH